MDNQRLHYLLRAARPSGADDTSPEVAEAIAHTGGDVALAAWFQQERAVDRSIAAKLREVRAPAELRAQILAGVEASQERRVRRPFALAVAALAAAASLALLVYTVWPRSHPVMQFDAIVATAVHDARDAAPLSFYSTNAADLRGWLEKESAPVPGQLPGVLAQLETVGCRAVTWQGVPASIVALRVEGHDTLRLFTVRQTSCAGGSAGTAPIVFAQENAAVATWRDSTNYYVLVSSGSPDDLRRLLGGGTIPSVAAKAPPVSPAPAAAHRG